MQYKRLLSVLGFCLFILIFMGNPSKAEAAIAFRSATTTNNTSACGTQSVTVNVPAGVVNGDVMVVGVQYGGTTQMSTPAGWTLINHVNNSFNTAQNLTTFYRVASSEPASYTWTMPALVCWITSATAYSGVDNSTPIDTQTTVGVTTGTSIVGNAVTTTIANDTIVTIFAGYNGTSTTWGPPSGQTERVDSNNASVRSIEANDSSQASVGSSGTFTATASVSNYGAIATIALKTANSAPTFNTQPFSQYSGSSTRTGPSTTWGVYFWAVDSEQTGANALSYQIRTAAGGGGSLVASGNFTSGGAINSNSLASYNATGLVNGSNTLWVRISDGTLSTDSTSFTLLRDDVAPTSSTSISTTPSPVTSTSYTVTFTPNDAVSTAANEIRYGVWTGAGGTGTLLTNGTATSATPKTTASFTDSTLVGGANTRYVRTCDGANNCTDTSFTVTYNAAPTVTTATSASITAISATLGGNVTSAGTTSITARGICYAPTGTDADPRIGDPGVTCTPEGGTTTGIFTLAVNNLMGNTGYSYNAYATNSIGTGYVLGTFSTLNPSPTSVGTSTNGTPQSYYVQLNGQANPNGYQTYGHFRLFTASPGNCSADSGGMRFPAGTTSFPDLDLGSGTSLITNITTPAFTYTIPLNSGSFLTPNTTYYYCAYAVSTVNSTNYTTGASGVVTFTTPDGPASPCDPPSNGNLTIPSGAACNFNGTFNGVDAGTGTRNTGVLNISPGVQLSVSAGQTLGLGSMTLGRGTVLTLARGSLVKFGPIYVHDKDGDSFLDDATQYVSSTASAATEFVRRNLINSTFNYAWKIASSGATYDCNNNSIYAFMSRPNLVRDADNDGYKTSAAAAPQCVGAASTINGRTYFKDSSNASTWMDAGSVLGGGATDCDDATGAPCQPTGGSASGASQTSMNVSWSAGVGPAATSYNVVCVSGGSCANNTNSTASSPYTHSSNPALVCGTSYTYNVVAVNAAGSSPASSNFSGSTVSCVAPPSITAQSTTSITNSSATFNSSVNGSGASTTITYRYGTSNLACSSLASTFAGTQTGFTTAVNDSTSKSGLTGNTTYYYCATATNSQGTTNGVGNNNLASSFLTKPGQPTLGSATGASATQINVSWTNPTGGATSYDMKWCYGASCTPGASGTAWGTTTNVTSIYAHTGLAGCGTTYTYIITANNASGSTDSASFSGSTTSCYSQSAYYAQAAYYAYAQSAYYAYAQSAYYAYAQSSYYAQSAYYSYGYSEGYYIYYSYGYSEAYYVYYIYCFLPGTKITMADGTIKNIEDVKNGDIVLSYDFTTHKTTKEMVTQKFVHPNIKTSYLIINDVMRVTGNHPIWVNNGWVQADDIKVGDNMKNLKGESIRVNTIQRIQDENRSTVYNLEVDNTHNYYADGVLVHNKWSP